MVTWAEVAGIVITNITLWLIFPFREGLSRGDLAIAWIYIFILAVCAVAGVEWIYEKITGKEIPG